MLVQRQVEARENVVERRGDRGFAALQGFRDVAGALDQGFIELARPFIQRRVQLFGIGIERGGTGCEFAEQFVTALAKCRAQRLELGVEFGRERHARRRQRLDQVFGLVCEQ